MSFQYCCKNPNKYEYNIFHDGCFDNETNNLLLNCLWRLPETHSIQANCNTIFSIDTYSDYLMKLLMEKLSVTEDDVKIVTDSAGLSKNDVEFYEEEICLNCTKLIFSKSKKRITIQEFLRHLRNCIAHGRFNIVRGIFIGFDMVLDNNSNLSKYTAVIKVPFDNLSNLVTDICNIADIGDFYIMLLNDLGYLTKKENEDTILAEKDGVKYLIKIRHYSGRYINKSDVVNFINEIDHIENKGLYFVLIVDSTYETKETKLFLQEKHVAVLDKSSLKELLTGKDLFNEICSGI